MKKFKKFIKNHFPKLAALLGIAIVSLTMIPISVSAAELTADDYTGQWYLFNDELTYNSLNVNTYDINFSYKRISTDSDGNPYLQDTIATQMIFTTLGYRYARPLGNDYLSVYYLTATTSGQFGWQSSAYRLIYITEITETDSSLLSKLVTFLNINGSIVSEDIADLVVNFGDELLNVDSSEIQNAYNSGYTNGKADGYQEGAEAGFGKDIVYQTFSAPHKILSGIELFDISLPHLNGEYYNVTIDLWMVISAALSITLLVAFLRLFAGG